MAEKDGKNSKSKLPSETDGEYLDRLLKQQLRDINARLIAKGHKPIKFRGISDDDDHPRGENKKRNQDNT